MLVRCVGWSVRDIGSSENRFPDSAPIHKKKNCADYINACTDHVFDVAKVCSKNEMQFPLRPHTSLLTYLSSD